MDYWIPAIPQSIDMELVKSRNRPDAEFVSFKHSRIKASGR